MRYLNQINIAIAPTEPTHAVRKQELDELKDIDKPYRPRIISPVNGETDVPTATRVTASEYSHPYSVPAGKSQWQIARDAAFTDIVMDTELVSAENTIIVTTDGQGTAWLEPSAQYFVRVRYFDLRDRESKWSEPAAFSTAASAETNVILAPDIITPVNTGWMPDKKLLVQLSQPSVIGAVNPDKADLQVSMTPLFGAGDVILDKQDAANTTLIIDDTADFSSAPSPLYLRGRQKDSIAGITSPWSSAPTVWLQRAFSGIKIGMEVYVNPGATMSTAYHIDETGKRISVNVDYFNNHPIWAAMTVKKYNNDAALPEQHFVRLPRFWVDAYTVQETDGALRHRFIVSPTPFSGKGYLHPAFANTSGGIWVGAYLLSQYATNCVVTVPEVAPVMLPYNENAINYISTGLVSAAGVSSDKIIMHNVHIDNALSLLMSIEKASLNGKTVDAGVGGINTSVAFKYRGLRALKYAEKLTIVGVRYRRNRCQITLDFGSPTDPVTLINFGTFGALGINYAIAHIRSIQYGYEDPIFGVPVELYFIPKDVVAGGSNPGVFPYWTQAGVYDSVSLSEHTIMQNTTNACTMGLFGNAALTGVIGYARACVLD